MQTPSSITMHDLIFGIYSFFKYYPSQVAYTENELKDFLFERREKYPSLLIPIFAECRSPKFSLARAIKEANYELANKQEVIDFIGTDKSFYQIHERCSPIFQRTHSSRFSAEQRKDLEALALEFAQRFSKRPTKESKKAELRNRFESLFR